jgi:hypothetical protein
MSPTRGTISDEQLDAAVALLASGGTIAAIAKDMRLSHRGLRVALEQRRGVRGRRYSKHLPDVAARSRASFRLDPGLLEQVAERAERDSVSASEVVSAALRAYFGAGSPTSPVVRIVNVSLMLSD